MKLVPKHQKGDTINLSATTVETPNYVPITQRTYFLETKRKKILPEDLKYSEFNKNPTKYIKTTSEYKYDPNDNKFYKNFKQIQISEQDISTLNTLKKPQPTGIKVGVGYLPNKK